VTTYVLDNASEHAAPRFASLEACHDPVSTRQLEEIGVSPRWSCLEFGGGGGSSLTLPATICLTAIRAMLCADSREAKPVSCDPAGCKRYTILPTEWSPGGDKLTPTQQLRRKPIAAKYAAEIDAIYAADWPSPRRCDAPHRPVVTRLTHSLVLSPEDARDRAALNRCRTG
jgi:hypothetical protein